MTSFHKINWIFERAFINSHVFASYEKTPCLFPDQAVSISNRRILFSCSGCFVLLFYFTTGASINNTQAARKNRDVITITNQPRFCDDVLEAIAEAMGTGGDFQACQSALQAKIRPSRYSFINDK